MARATLDLQHHKEPQKRVSFPFGEHTWCPDTTFPLAITIHNSKRDQSQSQESLTADSPIDQYHQVKSKRSHEEANSRVAIDEPEMIREEAATLGKVHVNRLDALNTPQSKYYVVTPTITDVTTAAANSTATTILVPYANQLLPYSTQRQCCPINNTLRLQQSDKGCSRGFYQPKPIMCATTWLFSRL